MLRLFHDDDVKVLVIRGAGDDFGTGHSSLSRLAAFPWDAIKIDRSFVFDLPNDKSAAVLVSTMIVESGLDVPNANTMFVNRADHMGLAQLYQLRGRVGRSKERAYAYLLVPARRAVTR